MFKKYIINQQIKCMSTAILKQRKSSVNLNTITEVVKLFLINSTDKYLMFTLVVMLAQ